MMSDLLGQVLLNRYRVDGFIGRGAMADVYKVWDSQRAAYLAMKLLREDLAMDTIFLRRFRREAQALAQLQHPNIVRFYGIEEADLLAFILMEYIEGSTLQREIHQLRQPLSFERVLEVTRPVCSALHYAHLQGMIHCDIKPSNVLIHNNGAILVTDFGLAHMSEAAATSVLMMGGGTFGYMAPEQARGARPTPQTDIYALGIVLYEALAGGERPFTGERGQPLGGARDNVLWEQTHLTPPSLKTWNPAVTDRLEQIVFRCLALTPEQRYASTLDLLEAVEHAIADTRGEAAPVALRAGALAAASQTAAPRNGVLNKPPRSRRWLLPIALLIILISLAGFFIAGRPGNGLFRGWPASDLGSIPNTSIVTTSPTVSVTPTTTPTPTFTFTPTATPTFTPTPTPTDTPTATATATPTVRPTLRRTRTPTATLLVPTETVAFTETPTIAPTQKPPEPPPPTSVPPPPTEAPP